MPDTVTILSHQAARARGFPASPPYGQIVVDQTGRVWVWPHHPGQGLGDLGQWVEAVGLGVSLISKLFGGGGPKPDNAARQMLEGQQAQIQSLSEQVAGQSFFDKKSVFIFALLGLGLVFAFKR
jgi:hypothetical protein